MLRAYLSVCEGHKTKKPMLPKRDDRFEDKDNKHEVPTSRTSATSDNVLSQFIMSTRNDHAAAAHSVHKGLEQGALLNTMYLYISKYSITSPQTTLQNVVVTSR